MADTHPALRPAKFAAVPPWPASRPECLSYLPAPLSRNAAQRNVRPQLLRRRRRRSTQPRPNPKPSIELPSPTSLPLPLSPSFHFHRLPRWVLEHTIFFADARSNSDARSCAIDRRPDSLCSPDSMTVTVVRVRPALERSSPRRRRGGSHAGSAPLAAIFTQRSAPPGLRSF
ncbi:hypothetical protein FA95DRAFT_914765 [Auriscalpium vulgare]|uniref:Uncharacterized protein n=1 Tax=Auriscalpium vulgare TaxID=40419 RepID=A0ACB8R962_9AGAM|nr:hypothetical protein FA95DRAFT_914765 [Auriscalpium vulgare]